MILSGPKARRIVSNYAILAAVPELQRPVESNNRKEKEFKARRDCRTCDETSFFAEVEKEAMDTIAALQPDAMRRLAEFVKEREILAYVSIPGQKPQYKQLFPVATK